MARWLATTYSFIQSLIHPLIHSSNSAWPMRDHTLSQALGVQDGNKISAFKKLIFWWVEMKNKSVENI